MAIHTEGDPAPIGLRTEGFVVLGQEWDGERRWVGANLSLAVPPVGIFMVRVVTKLQFGSEEIDRLRYDLDNPEELLEPRAETRPPFVLNDNEITEEVLGLKFGHREITKDLADCLWYDGPLEGANYPG